MDIINEKATITGDLIQNRYETKCVIKLRITLKNRTLAFFKVICNFNFFYLQSVNSAAFTLCSKGIETLIIVPLVS